MATLKDLLLIANPNIDEDEMISLLLKPSDDRKEMTKVYKKTLGYDPITKFDKNDIRAVLNDYIASTNCPLSKKDINMIVDTAMDEKSAMQESVIHTCITNSFIAKIPDEAKLFTEWVASQSDNFVLTDVVSVDGKDDVNVQDNCEISDESDYDDFDEFYDEEDETEDADVFELASEIIVDDDDDEDYDED